MKLDATTTLALPAGLALATASAGEVQALDSPVWLTVAGEPDDWVLCPGERLQLPAGAHAHAGPWHGSRPARLAWAPLRHPLRTRHIPMARNGAATA